MGKVRSHARAYCGPLVPAKAGTQKNTIKDKDSYGGASPAMTVSWIPAYAGMRGRTNRHPALIQPKWTG
jgi:hypothetical protein